MRYFCSVFEQVPEPQPSSQRAGSEFVNVLSLIYPETVFPEDVGMPSDFGCMIWYIRFSISFFHVRRYASTGTSIGDYSYA